MWPQFRCHKATFCCLVSALTLKNKCPFYGLVSDMVFTFFAFLLVISLSKMAFKHSAQVRSSVSKHKAGRVLYGKNTCV